MKFYDIALFLMIVNVFAMYFVSLSESLGYTEYSIFSEPKEEALTEMESEVQEGITQEEITGDDPVTYALGLIYAVVRNAILSVINPLKKYVLWLPYLLMNYGVPGEFAYSMGVIYYFIMIVGLVQIVTGRGFSQVE